MNRDRAFGGFFGLEAPRGVPLHAAAHAFSTASGALQQFLGAVARSNGFATIWVPTFLCPQVEIAIARADPTIEIRRYRLQENLEPLEYGAGPRDLFFFYNVFGLKGNAIASLPVGAIVDNAHAFFQPPAGNRATLYTARKFFGVPDGAYLYCDDPLDVPPRLSSSHRGRHLLTRIEDGPEASYNDFLESENDLAIMPPSGMSALAAHILDGIDYRTVSQLRLENFGFVHDALGRRNELSDLIDLALADPGFVPFSYPFLSANGADLRKTLIAANIYVPHLWDGLSQRPELTAFERHLADDTVHLPIDQRYRVADMEEMIVRGRLAD